MNAERSGGFRGRVLPWIGSRSSASSGLLDSPRLIHAVAGMEPVIENPKLLSALTLPSDDHAPGRARDFTRHTLDEWGFGELADRVLLIVSELATNARRHGRTCSEGEEEHITLTLAAQDDVVGVAVHDNSTDVPVQRTVPPGAVHGRGLYIVEAEADVWTVQPDADCGGKQVLAFLRRLPSPATDHVAAGLDPIPTQDEE